MTSPNPLRARSCRHEFPKVSDGQAVTDRSARLPTEAEIADINARHLIETPLKPADLLFVFGTREDVGERVDEACRLWREGYFRWAIVSGGITPGSGRTGSAVHGHARIAGRRPTEDCLREG